MNEAFFYFLQQLLNGLTVGSTYALIAIGYPAQSPDAPQRKPVADLLTYKK